MKSHNIQTNRKYSNCKPHRIKNKNSERITPQSHPCRKCSKNPKRDKKRNRYPKLSQKIKTRDSDKETNLLSITQKIEGAYQDAIEEYLIDQSTLLADLLNNAIELSEKKCISTLELIESLNKSMQDTIDYVSRDQKICEIKMLKILTKVNVQNFMINVNHMHNVYNIIPHDEQNEQRMAHCKAPTYSCLTVEHRHFTITIKKRHLVYNVSVSDIDTCSLCLFQKLAYFYIKSCLILNARQKRQFQPSNTMRAWYIRDLIQGFRLSIILKFNNASIIHYMRNLFFVIITSLNLRLTIELYFEFSNGKECGMSPPPTPFEKIPFKIIHWNNGHRNTLLNSCSRIFHTEQPPCIRARCDATRTTVSETILHNNTNLTASIATHANTSDECSEAVIKDSQLKSQIGILDIRNTVNYTNFALHESQRMKPLSVGYTNSYTNLALNESQRIMPLSIINTDIYNNFTLSQKITPFFVTNTDSYTNLALSASQRMMPLSIGNTNSYTNLALNESQRIMPLSIRNTDIYNDFALNASQKTRPFSVTNTDSYTNWALNESQRITPLSIRNTDIYNKFTLSKKTTPFSVRNTSQDSYTNLALNASQRIIPLSVKNTYSYINFVLNASQRIMPLSVRNTDIYNSFASSARQRMIPLSVGNTNSYTNLALNENQKIMPIPVGGISFLHGEQYTKCKNCSEVDIHPRKQIYRLRYSALQQRTWMSKVYKVSAKWKNEFLDLYLHSFINESVFEKVEIPLDKYLNELTTYCAQCLVNAFKYLCTLKFDLKLFYKTFMSYFGYYLLP